MAHDRFSQIARASAPLRLSAIPPAELRTRAPPCGSLRTPRPASCSEMPCPDPAFRADETGFAKDRSRCAAPSLPRPCGAAESLPKYSWPSHLSHTLTSREKRCPPLSPFPSETFRERSASPVSRDRNQACQNARTDSHRQHKGLSAFLLAPLPPSAARSALAWLESVRSPTSFQTIRARFGGPRRRNPASDPAKRPGPRRRASSRNPPAPYSALSRAISSRTRQAVRSLRPKLPRQTQSQHRPPPRGSPLTVPTGPPWPAAICLLHAPATSARPLPVPPPRLQTVWPFVSA